MAKIHRCLRHMISTLLNVCYAILPRQLGPYYTSSSSLNRFSVPWPEDGTRRRLRGLIDLMKIKHEKEELSVIFHSFNCLREREVIFKAKVLSSKSSFKQK
jgi:hypothetical protein